MGTKIKQFQITDNAIDSVKVENGTVVDTDISPSANISESKIQNLTQDLNSKVNLSGDTLTGPLTLNANPTQPLHACPRQYLDSLLLTVTPGKPERVSYIECSNSSGPLAIGPYVITVGSVSQMSTLPVNIDLTNNANFESGFGSSGIYYIYATGTGFILSQTAPVSTGGLWIRSGQGWRCIGSIYKSGSFLPFLKINKTVLFKNYQTIFSTGSNVTAYINAIGPITVSEILCILFTSASDTHASTSVSASISLLDPHVTGPMDTLRVAGSVINNANRAVAIQDTQHDFAPVSDQNSPPVILISGKGTVYQNGYIENMF